VLVGSSLGVPLRIGNLPVLVAAMILAGLSYYLVETGLLAAVVSLAQGTPLLARWREQFGWLTGHYLVLGTLGLFLALAYTALGWPGVVVFLLPLFLMRYAQQQYAARTEQSIGELKRLNEELTRANREAVAELTRRAASQIDPTALHTDPDGVPLSSTAPGPARKSA
jgi:hypothetical protein